MLRTMGRGKDLDALVETMNKAAEQAVPEGQSAAGGCGEEDERRGRQEDPSGGDDAATQLQATRPRPSSPNPSCPPSRPPPTSWPWRRYNRIASKAGSLGSAATS